MLSKIQILLLLLLIVMGGFIIKDKMYPKAFMREGFKVDRDSEHFKYATKPTDIYDKFYCGIYDDLMLDSKQMNFILNNVLKIKSVAAPLERKHEVTALDVGSGTGHYVSAMNENGIKALGIDVSPSMVEKAQKNYPDYTYINANVENTMGFQPSSFNLITCFYYTIYYIDEKHRFLANCYQWLKPGGTLVIHVVNRKKFSPIVAASDPIMILSPQNYSKKRITESVAEFNNFKYKAKFSYDESSEEGKFDEYFKFYKKPGSRQNEHKLKMIGIKPLIKMAKGLGFSLKNTIHLGKCGYDYQYLVVLQKKH